MEAFMDDFFVVGDSFDYCLAHLITVLKRYEERNFGVELEKIPLHGKRKNRFG